MHILVLGASGQLGNCLKKVASERAIDSISFPNEQEGNVLEIELLEKLFEIEKPKYAINCAAYTAVDKAEIFQKPYPKPTLPLLIICMALPSWKVNEPLSRFWIRRL